MFIKSCKTLFAVKGNKYKITSLGHLSIILRNYRNIHQGNCGGLNIWDEDLTQDVKFKIEEHWKDKLHYSGFDLNKEDSKFYILSMFPYPSGSLHMGHIRVYSISDTLARFYRMSGKNVLHPIGWDAFGLPAENAAIERGLSSESWTTNNIDTMREQLRQLRCTFDWDREIATCYKNYYKFTQMIFLKMYEQGLVYQKKSLVNWDPVDKTVLAAEQVDEEGCSWRSGAKVEKKVLKQWFIRTTAFAKALHEGLNRTDLEDWKDVIDMQKQWIGVCNGVSFEFPIKEVDGELTLWTDKPEHLVRAKFAAVSPGSVLDLETGGSGNRKLDLHLINKLTGQLLPIYVSNEFSFHEGSDGHIGIPEVYESDMVFARKAGLPLGEISQFPVQDNVAERQSVIEKLNGRITSSRIRDWLISRQRHWGTPIPILHCCKCGAQPIEYDKLPVELPLVEKVAEKGSRQSYSEEWISTFCPKCGGPAKRDLDTMDTFVDSSWYYLRYLDPHNNNEPFNKASAAKLMPVDIYIGGKEHALLHLYYARFVSYFLHSIGWLPDPEPFKRLLVQGMVMGKTYTLKNSGKYIPASQVDLSGETAVEKSSGELVVESWEKMSKSKHNGVDPSEVFQKYGIDTTRLLIMASVAPFSQRNWDESIFPGVLNWQHKLWMTVQQFRNARFEAESVQKPRDISEAEVALRHYRNYYLKGILYSYRVIHQFNNAIANMQGLTGHLRRYGKEYKAHSLQFERALAMQVVALSPLAPHFAAQLWSGLQDVPHHQTANEFDWTKQAHQQIWPDMDRDFKAIVCCVVNLALKDKLNIPVEELNQLTVASATQLALTSPEVRAYTDQSPILDAKFKLYPDLHATIELTVDKFKLNFEKDHNNKKNKSKKKRINE